MIVWLVDGTPSLLAEARRLIADVDWQVAPLSAAYATAAPNPGQRARDKLAAEHEHPGPAFAEAIDVTTVEGRSLQLDRDSENDSRFCRWMRETPALLVLSVAVRDATGKIDVHTTTTPGTIAERPAGGRDHGWERLFVLEGQTRTLAQQLDAGAVVGPRATLYPQLTALLR